MVIKKDEFTCPLCSEKKKQVAGIMGKYNNAKMLLCRRCQYKQKKGLTPRQIRKAIAKENR